MMLCRKMGIGILLIQRLQRVLLPCIAMLYLIVPAFLLLSDWSRGQGRQQPQPQSQQAQPKPESTQKPETAQAVLGSQPDATPVPEAVAEAGAESSKELRELVRSGNVGRVQQLLKDGADPNEADPETGFPPLHVAAARGNLAMVKLLTQYKANIKTEIRGGNQVLQTALVFGRREVVEFLVSKGANPNQRRGNTDLAGQALRTNEFSTQTTALKMGIPKEAWAAIQERRTECKKYLNELETAQEQVTREKLTSVQRVRADYRQSLRDFQAFLASPVFTFNVFHHLWMLWVFWCLLLVFALFFAFTKSFRLKVPSWVIMSPYRLLWLIPLTMVPQFFMQMGRFGFGADPAPGWVPEPHLAIYYGIFFTFGLIYYNCQDADGKLGRYWWVWILTAFGLALPVGLLTTDKVLVGGLASVVFAWSMCFGMIGLFFRFFNPENRVIRNLCDASFFIYLFYPPVLMAIQGLARRWNLPIWLMFLLAFLGSIGVLYSIYVLFLQKTKMGGFLSGLTTKRVQDSMLATRS